MKRPLVISAGLLLFLFGLAIAKAGYSEQKADRNPASVKRISSPNMVAQ
jgi:hypothetical protein